MWHCAVCGKPYNYNAHSLHPYCKHVEWQDVCGYITTEEACAEEIQQQENKRWILAILARVQIEVLDFPDIDLSNVQFENIGQAWGSLPTVFRKDEVRQVQPHD